MATRPVVRLFVACSSGTPGTVVDQHRLADLTNSVRPKAGDQYPLLLPELCFYAILTDGRGRHTFAVREWVSVELGRRLVWQSRSVVVDLGSDPLAIRGFPIRFRNIEFRVPGQYEFALVCDDVELQSVFIEARD